MKNETYFHSSNYNGNHLHVDNYEDKFTPFIEGIAWVRLDGSMDLFFNEFMNESERQSFLTIFEPHFDENLGVFIKCVKTDEEADDVFREWVQNVFEPFRNQGK
ncbi:MULTISPECIES: hypothetical protein [unclassified Bacillus (in: firmicutes)]|uniref:hypothetical protein n=1 Tax=unclassified Bacillus (in: firmicutes) TaxID=185979 RepID=UPI0008E2D0FD|nr:MULTISPECIES: hypothetical protein [unclassified Bacillus (in: firmicutes)]SFA85604.1 hypothetical protein SAMN02799634_10242 [Bacillus sp. UNCCL13]SFQ83476.1 hypothetical protein SAMN04488577_2161 [Bacillus sp. cl95]